MVGHCSHCCSIMNTRVDVNDLEVNSRIRVGDSDVGTVKYIGEVIASHPSQFVSFHATQSTCDGNQPKHALQNVWIRKYLPKTLSRFCTNDCFQSVFFHFMNAQLWIVVNQSTYEYDISNVSNPIIIITITTIMRVPQLGIVLVSTVWRVQCVPEIYVPRTVHSRLVHSTLAHAISSSMMRLRVFTSDGDF